MDKGLRVAEVEAARARLGDAGIRACYFLQFGYPGEQWEDIQQTIELVRNTRPDDIGVSFSYPLPGTAFFDRVQEQIGSKRNWTDSDDLCLMFKAAYKDEFYLALRNALHAEVDSWHVDPAAAGLGSPFGKKYLRSSRPAKTLRPPSSRQYEEAGRASLFSSSIGEGAPMAELLLAHGYFLYEDPKELQIMKPYAPLGILYLCSHLRQQGFDVDVFDTTFSSREALFQHLRSEKPSVLGIYANLMTRKNVVETLKVAREAGWKTIVGGPEPGAYALEYLQAGADFVVFGEGELTVGELLESFRCGTRTPTRRLPASPTSMLRGKCMKQRNARRLPISIANPGRLARPSTSTAM